MSFKNKNTFLQYTLWVECHNGCQFCCNSMQKDLNKIESMKWILNNLQSQDVKNFNQVGFIGGQFFDREIKDQNVKTLFYQIFKKVSTMHFDKIYFATMLIYDMNPLLIPFLDYLRELKILNKCLLCTSYDVKYRFHGKDKEELWKNNVKLLHQLYPELRIHTEIILTQHFIDAVLSEEFSITKFQNEFNTRIDYIQPSSGFRYLDKKDCQTKVPGFFPTKSSYIKFLIKTVIKNNQIELATFLSMELRSSKLYYIDCGQRYLLDHRRQMDFIVIPKDPTKKYEIGFVDSNQSMRNIALNLYNTIGDSFNYVV